MQIRVKATKIKLTPELHEYIQEKMDMLEKYLGTVKPTNCDVEICMSVGGQSNGEIYQAEVNLELPGELLRVEKTEKDIHKAIDKVKDHLAQAIKKYRGKKFGI
jgi:ribosomal subunit interface protein